MMKLPWIMLALILTATPVYAASIDVGLSAGETIELLYTGSISSSDRYLAEANIALPGSGCFYTQCFDEGLHTLTMASASALVTINGSIFGVSNFTCDSPDSCVGEPPFGGVDEGPASEFYSITAGPISGSCVTDTFSSGNLVSSQDCSGSLSFSPVELTLDIPNSEGDFAVVTPLPETLPLFATGLGALGLLGWRRKRNLAASLLGAA